MEVITGIGFICLFTDIFGNIIWYFGTKLAYI